MSALPAPGDPKALYLLDLAGYVFRAYHALPPLSNGQGVPTHAIRGVISMIRKLETEQQPAMWAVALESRDASVRLDIDPSYKANRPPPPPDLSEQMTRIITWAECYGMRCFGHPGMEADDVIATLTRRAREAGWSVVIVSADKDLLQLVDAHALMYDPMRGRVWGVEETVAKYGVEPSQMRDFLALTGDKVDNVPGVPSIGPKSAAILLQTWTSLDGLYAHLDDVDKASWRVKLQQHEADARRSQQLVSLYDNLAIPFDAGELARKPGDLRALAAMYADLDFRSFHAEAMRALQATEGARALAGDDADTGGANETRQHVEGASQSRGTTRATPADRTSTSDTGDKAIPDVQPDPAKPALTTAKPALMTAKPPSVTLCESVEEACAWLTAALDGAATRADSGPSGAAPDASFRAEADAPASLDSAASGGPDPKVEARANTSFVADLNITLLVHVEGDVFPTWTLAGTRETSPESWTLTFAHKTHGLMQLRGKDRKHLPCDRSPRDDLELGGAASPHSGPSHSVPPDPEREPDPKRWKALTARLADAALTCCDWKNTWHKLRSIGWSETQLLQQQLVMDTLLASFLLQPNRAVPDGDAWLSSDPSLQQTIQHTLTALGSAPFTPHRSLGSASNVGTPSIGTPSIGTPNVGNDGIEMPDNGADNAGPDGAAQGCLDLSSGEDLRTKHLATTWAMRNHADALRHDVQHHGLVELLATIELPLTPVLARLEDAGVGLDTAHLHALAEDMRAQLKDSETRAHDMVGHAFNLNAPRQIEGILFDELQLPSSKKTKTARSTDSSVLEELAPLHPLPAILLEHRATAKLLGTYVETLPKQVHPSTGRLHTRFHQAVAATGRLSSSHPNVQNIPIRTEQGRAIRQAFVADGDNLLLSADYSQIELRVLAHLSRDARLCEAFASDADVHAQTASALFEVPEDQVTRAMRAQGKTVNFAVIYGQTQFALAKSLGISRPVAARYIEAFFARYAGVKACFAALLEEARSTGQVRTMFGRARPIADIHSRNHALRSAAERVACNAPIQGSAADILKRAMISLDAAMRAASLHARMVLTVHDELVFEAPKQECDTLQALVLRHMREAATLSVPLVVEHGWGRSWLSAH